LAADIDALLYVVGGPDRLIDKYRSEFNNNERVIFKGQVDYFLVPLYLRSFDVVIIPMPEGKHARTTSPMKLFEYLASGKTIIAPRIQSITKYLKDNNSILFDSDSAEALSEKIKIAINNPELTYKLSQQALIDAKNYSWRNRAKLILDFIK